MLHRLRFRVALWLWARLLPVLAWERKLDSLLALSMPVSGTTPYRGLAADYIVRRVKKSTRRPWLMRDRPCLRDGVLALRFLRLAGYAPILHFGVDRESVTRDALSAHCWVALDRKTILNPPAPSMVEVLVYAGDRLVPPAPNDASLARVSRFRSSPVFAAGLESELRNQ